MAKDKLRYKGSLCAVCEAQHEPGKQRGYASCACGAWIQTGKLLGDGHQCNTPLCAAHATLRSGVYLCPAHAPKTKEHQLPRKKGAK